MTRTTHSFSTIKPRSNAAGKRIHHRAPGAIRFCAIDGEGIDRDGKHRYALIGVGQDQIVNENGFTWQECFKFLYSHYEKGVAFVGFFLGYDFNQMFKTLPEERARMLLTERGRAVRKRRGKNPAPWPVECDGWEFDILAMKRLKIRPKSCEHPRVRAKPSCKCRKLPWMNICDAGGFFQQSFLTVINPDSWRDPIVTPEEYAIIQEGKRKRSDQSRVTQEMMTYNALENTVLERVMTVLDRGLREIGVNLPPSKWFGPGQAAQAWIIGEGLPKSDKLLQNVPDWALDAARNSYFGGWFEIMMHGLIPGVTHEYDINSAYPYIISMLPCLQHGSWERGMGIPVVKDGELCLVKARVWTRSSLSHNPVSKRLHIGAMLHRDNAGRISRPTVTEGWYWWHELQAAIRAKCVQPFRRSSDDLHPICWEWIKYKPCNCLPPMWRVKNLYLQRLTVGKDSPLGKACRLVYNSEYGKFAQSVGNPLFGNPIYASLITAGCRTMILDAIATHPKGQKDVAMVATDAVYFLSPHPSLQIGNGLGEWGYKPRSNMCLFKPGVYWDDGAREQIRRNILPHFKARGISAQDFASQVFRIDAEFERIGSNPPGIGDFGDTDNPWPRVTFATSFSMVTCQQAIQRNDWRMAGYVTDCDTRVQSSNPEDKRANSYFDAEIGVIRSEPRTPELVHRKVNGEWQAFWDCASVPYEKRFGLDDPFSQESKESMGITPDGNAYELIGFAWKGMVDG